MDVLEKNVTDVQEVEMIKSKFLLKLCQELVLFYSCCFFIYRTSKKSKRSRSKERKKESSPSVVKTEKALTDVFQKIVPKLGIDLNKKEKSPPPAKSVNPHLISVSTTTAQILAARAAAIAAAQNISAQLMQQITPGVNANAAKSSQSYGVTPYESANRKESNLVSKVNEAAAAKSQAAINAEKEAEQRRLEEEMRKRRERIEKWRNEKKTKDQSTQQQQQQLQQQQLQQQHDAQQAQKNKVH